MRRPTAVAAGLALVVAVAAAAVVYVESATVTVLVPTHVITADVTIAPGVVATHLRHLELTDSIETPASDVNIDTYATGTVVFWSIQRCVRPPCPSYGAFPGFDVYTASGVHYKTLVQAYWGATGSSRPVPIRAVNPGPGGNTAANTVIRVQNLYRTYMGVTNPAPIRGGSSRQTKKVLTSDLEGTIKTLRNRLIDELQSAFQLSEPGMTYFPAAPPTFSALADHGVGEEVPAIHVSMTASVDAYGFAERDVRAGMRAELERHLAPGHELTPDTVHIAYGVDDFGTGGAISFSGRVIGYEFFRPDLTPYGHQIATKTVSQATGELAQAFPGSEVRVELSPAGMPFMPFAPDHIVFKVEPRPLSDESVSLVLLPSSPA